MRYEKRTGKEIEKIPDGRSSYVRQSDMDDLIRLLYPLQARKKGLI